MENIQELLNKQVKAVSYPIVKELAHLQIVQLQTDSRKWHKKEILVKGRTEFDLDTKKNIFIIDFKAYCIPTTSKQEKSPLLDCSLIIYAESEEDAQNEINKVILALQTTKLTARLNGQHLPIVSAKCSFINRIYETIQGEQGETMQVEKGRLYQFDKIEPFSTEDIK